MKWDCFTKKDEQKGKNINLNTKTLSYSQLI